jgi:hypothetical protein
MNTFDAATLVNLLGFMVGIALYGLLGSMVLYHRRSPRDANYLLLTTAMLGLLWNIGELIRFLERDLGQVVAWPVMTALSYSALGFLPSVVVHSAQDEGGRTSWLAYAAYALSTAAAVMHFYSAIFAGHAPSETALQTLTLGAVLLTVGLLIFNFRQTLEKKAIWATALLIFAASALHLSGSGESSSWLVEMVAHQSSLPLALAILYQNYRFAFADLFLKRAISLILLTLVAGGLYVWVAAPLLRYHETHDRNDVQAVTLILTLWIATALVYPALHRLAVWLVDKVILQRADYDELQRKLVGEIESVDSEADVLGVITRRLAGVLTAGKSGWSEVPEQSGPYTTGLVALQPGSAEVTVPTAEEPAYSISLGDFHGGRRLLSDETAMLEAIALAAARRIDALRVVHERYEREYREQEFSKLATEAQLTALRAQINPHFLFNALTTIGYLIQTTPDKAFQTLLQLTKLLRGVLGKTAEFSTLGDEIKLIESYLDIERARFEERLKVEIEVPKDLDRLHIPSLIIQPLVENAIKHAVSENRAGGTVRITAALRSERGGQVLSITVTDTGSGKRQADEQEGDGTGLANIRGRLRSHYGDDAGLTIDIDPIGGTIAEIRIAVEAQAVALAGLGND